MMTVSQGSRTVQKESSMRELAITGLTHLVSANAESGFRQCLSLAYDKDKKKRAIFAHVFARVIRQGTRFERQDRSETQARRNRLCEVREHAVARNSWLKFEQVGQRI